MKPGTKRRAAGFALLLGASTLARAQDPTPVATGPEPAAKPAPGAAVVPPDREAQGGNLSYIVNPIAPQPDNADPNQAWLASFYPSLFSALRDPADSVLGASLREVEEPVRSQLALEPKTGLLVASVAEDGPAARAGLKQNDVLVYLAGVPLGERGDLSKQLKAAGEKPVKLQLIRSGKPLTLTVRPVSRVTLGPAEPEKAEYYIGVAVSPPDAVLRAHLSIPEGQGLIATDVVANGPAGKAGVKLHDVLLKFNDAPLDRPETLAAQVQLVGGKPLTLHVVRAGKPVAVSVTPEVRKDAGGVAQAWDETAQLGVRFFTPPAQAYSDVLKLYNPYNPTDPTKGAKVERYYPVTRPVTTTRSTPPHYTVTRKVDTAVAPKAGAVRETRAASPSERIDELEKEVKALRKGVDEALDALKKAK